MTTNNQPSDRHRTLISPHLLSTAVDDSSNWLLQDDSDSTSDDDDSERGNWILRTVMKKYWHWVYGTIICIPVVIISATNFWWKVCWKKRSKQTRFFLVLEKVPSSPRFFRGFGDLFRSDRKILFKRSWDCNKTSLFLLKKWCVRTIFVSVWLAVMRIKLRQKNFTLADYMNLIFQGNQ